MKYIGNKNKLLNQINEILIKENINLEGKIILDGFLGTGSFSKFVITKNVKKIYGVELLKSMCLYAKYNILGISKERFDYVKNLFKINKKTKPYFYKFFSTDSERNYFTNDNAKKIDNFLSYWDSLNDIEKGLGIDMIDKVSNTSGTYGAFLKVWRPAALKKIESYKYKEYQINFSNLEIINDDILNFKKKVDIAYFDPPYNTRQYGSYYHVLERLVDKDTNIESKTGVIKKDSNQLFSTKKFHFELIKKLIQNINSKIIIFSYSNEGLISETKWKELLSEYKFKIYKMNYKRFKTNKLISETLKNGDNLSEMLIVIYK